ncbi:methyltransferase domain containing protein [Nitzschia inconspicua]|uniref:Methyltransferase domain containing protein n=1 Tax=Nitzschia inconspicua TaxID=303405 RepID=A0A9K3KK60_9STRA|nr:methyltransferase domain containing protein [Nitzschia inconspicua]
MRSNNKLGAASTDSFRRALQLVRDPQKILILTLSAIVLFFLSLLHLNGDIKSTDALDKYNERFVSGEEIHLTDKCKEKLDALDRFHDQRRAARIQFANKAKEAGKNVYEMYWKLRNTNDTVREEQHRKNLMFDLFEPEAVCLMEERFGGLSDERFVAFGDGPKFVCGVDYIRESYEKRNQRCLVYSVGSYNDIKFERAVKSDIGCEIHTFDPTLRTPFVGNDYADFHPWGLGKEGEIVRVENPDLEFTTQSVENVMKKLGHVGRKIDIFKIDCEGCEFEAMPPVFEAITNGTLRIDQLLIEMHTRVSYEVMTDFFEAADRAGFRITHKERNGWGCGGTRCVEYAFVNESFLRTFTASAIC